MKWLLSVAILAVCLAAWFVPDNSFAGENTPQKLSVFPEKGSVRAELLDLGIRDYRQTSWKAYRLIYRIVDEKVYVYVIGDGRQDFRTLLMRRLLSA